MFNLDKAIQTWKKDLAGKSPLDDTYIYELEAALRDEVADLVSQGIREEDAFERVRTEMGDMPEIGREFSKVRRPHRRRGLSGLQRFILPPLLWNYVHIAVRKIRRQKGYSFINIAGLAVGLACCILMMLWIRDELSFDRFHENGNTIYRLISDIKIETGNILDARTPTPFATGLDLEIPEVEAVCRFRSNNSYGLRVDDTSYFDIWFGITETPFLSMFTFPLLVGDPKTALDDPRSIILTESLAQKLFKGRNPMGESLATGGGRSPFTVTGIMADLPENSHLRFDCLIPAINMAEFHHVDFNSWNSMFLGAYVKLSSEASPTETARKITELLERRSGKTDITVHLQPLKDIHLKSHFAFDQDNYAQGNLSILQTFSLAAAAILLLACINFMNLST
ncbi:MAG: ABC transporter permease, partial [Candidatus Aminicenantes bacterium]|nr:ABC transporter permease [Candidatus Aminicenantes bacterium]